MESTMTRESQSLEQLEASMQAKSMWYRNRFNWVCAQWALSIWNPDLVSHRKSDSSRRKTRLMYKTQGIVAHDRALRDQLDIRL